jgi:hypothetical protein
MWQGDVFHSLAASYLNELHRGCVDASRLVRTAVGEMRKAWDSSLSHRYRELYPIIEEANDAVPAKHSVTASAQLALFEHEYELLLGTDALDKACESVSIWFNRFVGWTLETELASVLRDARRLWIEPPTFGPAAPGFMVGSVRVMAKVDLAIHARDGRFLVFDWKTGRPRTRASGWDDDAEYQVTLYQLWPHFQFGIPLNLIEARAVFLGADPVLVRTYGIDTETKERATRRVGSAIRRAIALHGEGDHAPVSERDFDFAGHPSMCRWCAFKRLCQGELQS